MSAPKWRGLVCSVNFTRYPEVGRERITFSEILWIFQLWLAISIPAQFQLVSLDNFLEKTTSEFWCSFLENYLKWKLFLCYEQRETSNNFFNLGFHLQYLSFQKLGNLNLQFRLNQCLTYFAELLNKHIGFLNLIWYMHGSECK